MKTSYKGNFVSENNSGKHGSVNTMYNQRGCFFCGKMGHKKKDCYFYKRQNPDKNKDKNNDKNNEKAKCAQNEDEVCLGVWDNISNIKNNEWIIDSAATSHMVNDKKFFDKFIPLKNKIYLADGSYVVTEGVGSGRIKIYNELNDSQSCYLENVLYIPKLDGNLLSIIKMVQKGICVEFKNNKCTISKNNKEIGVGYVHGNIYTLKTNIEKLYKTIEKGDIKLWHRRLGHRNFDDLELIRRNKIVDGIEIFGKNNEACENCFKGKFAKLKFEKSESKTNGILELIHSDVCGPLNIETPGEKRYILTLIDDYSHYVTIYLLKNKSEVSEKIIHFVELNKNKFDKIVKTLRSDNGGEYISHDLKNYFTKNGIKHEFTCPYTPEQNGKAERMNRSLIEMTRCMLEESGLEKKFWGEAVNTACYLLNRLPYNKNVFTPYEKFFSIKPNLSHVKTFGAEAYAWIPNEKRNKLDAKAEKLILVGYSENSKAYRLLNKETCKITISRHVKFVEDKINNKTGNVMSDNVEQDTVNEDEFVVSLKNKKIILEDNVDDNDDINSEHSDYNDHSKNLFEENQEEPLNYKQMLLKEDKDLWLKAMEEEIECMNDSDVWTLVEREKSMKVLSNRWVYKIKKDPITGDNIYRARLVAKGYNQLFGEDYENTFAPVVKQITFRILLNISGTKNYFVKHFDIKTAFLNGELEEVVYMQQPEGFRNNDNLVCKLSKSIYGLKQAARCWNIKLTQILRENDFEESLADNCLFIKKSNNIIVYVLIYVDDIVVSSNDEVEIQKFYKILSNHFSVKNLGNISNYLGIEVNRDEDGIFYICQKEYITTLLNRFSLNDSKISNIPMDTGYYRNDLKSKTVLEDNNLYRKAIGSLLYLCLNSRPDITSSVIILSRKNEKPLKSDWNEVKRIFKYLKGTINDRLMLGSGGFESELVGYSDADWAGDCTDRKSTSGYVIQLSGSTIDWKTQKQNSVSLSSCESEYIALTELCTQLKWIVQLLKDMGVVLRNISVYEDNQSTLKLLDSEKIQTRSKHIDVRYNFVKEIKRLGEMNFYYCDTQNMPADLLTKPLSGEKIKRFKLLMGLTSQN